MRSLIPFDGLFGDAALDDFFDDIPTVYRDYTAVPKVNIEDLKDHYEVTCEMPGFTKDQVHVSYNNGVLSIAAKKDEKNEVDDKDHKYLRRERAVSSYQRQFAVSGIKEDQIQASLKDGVLKIELPKQEKEIQSDSHQIKIE